MPALEENALDKNIFLLAKFSKNYLVGDTTFTRPNLDRDATNPQRCMDQKRPWDVEDKYTIMNAASSRSKPTFKSSSAQS